LVLFSGFRLLLLWAAGRDRASTLYVFDSFPGLCIIGLNLAAGALFIFFLYRSRRDERDEEKQHFYYLLGVTLAHVSFPLCPLCLASASQIQPTSSPFSLSLPLSPSLYSLTHFLLLTLLPDSSKPMPWLSGVCYSWWFLSLPVVVGVAEALSPWVRERIVTLVQLAIDAVGYGGTVHNTYTNSAVC
jgi:hypothetical protein